MATLRRIWENRGGEENDRSQQNFSEPYRFIANAGDVFLATADVLAAATLLGLPTMYSSHPEALAAKVVNRAARQTEEPRVWVIELTYSTITAVEDRGSIADPLLRPPEYSFSFAKHQKALQKDRLGNAIVTSARQAFDPPIEADDSRPVLRVTRYESTFSAAIAVQYADKVNADTFAGADAGVWKVMDISARETVENGQVVQHVTYEFEGRPETWRLKVLDQGTQRLNVTTRRPEDILETKGPAQGTLVTAPVPLNGDGRPLSDAFSNLAADVDAVNGTIEVDDTSFFCPIETATAQGGEVVVQVEDEIMRVTEIVGATTLNVIRGYRNTTAAAHASAGTPVVQQLHFFIEFILYDEVPFGPLGLGL